MDHHPSSTIEVSKLEHLAEKLLAEHRSARRWRNFFRLGWLLFIVAVFWAIIQSPSLENATNTTHGEHSALVSIVGEIAPDAEASASRVVTALQKAFENPNAQGVLLLINSPGGSPVQAGIINDEILRLKKLHKKPVYAVVEESATSAAYYIAVAADKIYVDKASMIGSIGVLFDGFGAVELMKKVGVERRLLTAGDHKGILDPFSPEKPEDKAHAQSMLNAIHQQFIAAVKSGRGERLKEAPDTFSGLFWTGQEAVSRGLVDALGNVDYVAREVIKAQEVVDYTRQDDVLERIAKRFGAALGQASINALQNSMKVQ